MANLRVCVTPFGRFDGAVPVIEDFGPRRIGILVSQGQNMVDAIRQIGVSEVTYYRWCQEFGGLKTEQVKRLKDLELENNRLRKAVSDLLELRRSLLQLDRTRQELQDQREKSERLLHNMLPVAVAQELKDGHRVTARFYDAATILFADFEGFTKLAESMEPKELIGQLDDYFSAFDEIAERHRLEMLKTIGDAYMCVGGVPETNRSHSIDACLAALEMQQLIAGMNRERKKLRLPHWDLRVGLHTGPVIAGVVGRRKFIYDVWGDAVNVAARMESAGAAGKINVSEAIYHRTKDLFDFEPRGSVESKNKGWLEMFFLLRIKTSFARDGEGYAPNEAFLPRLGRHFPFWGPRPRTSATNTSRANEVM